MIKIRIKNADHEIDIRFPISESELFAKLGEIHAMVYAISGTLMFFFSAAVLLCNIVITYFNLGKSFSCLNPHTIMA